MIILPAIDLKGGRCVRLQQGRMDRETVYAEDPVQMAIHWEELGAEYLHVVDLDGASEGRPRHAAVVEKIVKTVKMPVEIGGGIREKETVREYLSFGVERVVIGTVAYQSPELLEELCRAFPGKIVVGVDASGGKVAIRGWKEVTHRLARDIVKEVEERGAAAVIYTDIKRDGMLTGPNIEEIQGVASVLSVPVIASGGVSSVDDIVALKELEEKGVEGTIVGKALYEGVVNLPDLIQVAGTK